MQTSTELGEALKSAPLVGAGGAVSSGSGTAAAGTATAIGLAAAQIAIGRSQRGRRGVGAVIVLCDRYKIVGKSDGKVVLRRKEA